MACQRGEHWYGTRAVRSKTSPPAGIDLQRNCATPPKPVKVIALMTLLIGVALMLAALLY